MRGTSRARELLCRDRYVFFKRVLNELNIPKALTSRKNYSRADPEPRCRELEMSRMCSRSLAPLLIRRNHASVRMNSSFSVGMSKFPK